MVVIRARPTQLEDISTSAGTRVASGRPADIQPGGLAQFSAPAHGAHRHTRQLGRYQVAAPAGRGQRAPWDRIGRSAFSRRLSTRTGPGGYRAADAGLRTSPTSKGGRTVVIQVNNSPRMALSSAPSARGRHP